MAFDEGEGTFQFVNEDGAEKEGNAEAEGVGQQHTHACQHVTLLGGQQKGRAEESAYAGGPAEGKDDAEQHRGEEIHVGGVHIPLAATEEVQLEHAEETKAEEDDDGTCDDVHGSAVAA